MSRGIFFLYDHDDEQKPEFVFGNQLVRSFGQSPANEADVIISIGGDGNLIRGLRMANGRAVAGLLPPDSNSKGFWTNHGIRTAEDLERFLRDAKAYIVRPLEARIHFSDGTSTLRHAFNDIVITQRAQLLDPDLVTKFSIDDIDMSVQSALVELSIHFNEAHLGPKRIMGNGVLFSTAFGSTAANRSNGGPAVDMRQETIILTGLAISDPPRGFSSIVGLPHGCFTVRNLSPAKRPLQLTFDSFAVQTNEAGSSIDSVDIRLSQDICAHILLSEDPSLRAYSGLMI
jgi:NAD+ kinase